MRIEQASVAGCAGFFKGNFLSRWGLKDYCDINAPCVFLGAEQIDMINNHKGFKVIYLLSEYDCIFLNYINNGDNVVLHHSPFLKNYENFKIKNVEIELKDYSLFKPNKLGNNIYSYFGYFSRANEFNHSLILEIQKRIDFKIEIMAFGSLYEYLTIEELKKEHYDNCFLNLNLSKGTAMTTIRELGLMGRKTITNSPYKFPSQIEYTDIDDIVRIINEESKKIGTIQPSIDCHTVGDEWLDVSFWLN